MKIEISTFVAIILAAAVFILYVSNVRPVGWFDSIVAMILSSVVFIVVKRFQGFK